MYQINYCQCQNAYGADIARSLAAMIPETQTLVSAYATFYSIFLYHAGRASAAYGIDTLVILTGAGLHKMFGGPGNMIAVALDRGKSLQ